jgi:hypothetical protein
MPSAIVVLLYALAVARATTLITHDEISAPIRAWLVRKANFTQRSHRLMAYMLGSPDDENIGCPWCVSIWIASMSAPIVWFWSNSAMVMIPILALSASQIVGMIFTVGRNT